MDCLPLRRSKYVWWLFDNFLTAHGRHIRVTAQTQVTKYIFNTLNAELNPICHLLALLGAHHILHVSRIRVNYLTPWRSRRSKTIDNKLNVDKNYLVAKHLLHISDFLPPQLCFNHNGVFLLKFTPQWSLAFLRNINFLRWNINGQLLVNATVSVLCSPQSISGHCLVP